MPSNFYLLSNVSDLYIIESWNFKSNLYLLFGADTMVEKYLGLDGTFYLSFNASELDRYILLGGVDFDMVFSSTATTNLVILRLLSDMDDDTLSVYDGMDLSEVAIITID